MRSKSKTKTSVGLNKSKGGGSAIVKKINEDGNSTTTNTNSHMGDLKCSSSPLKEHRKRKHPVQPSTPRAGFFETIQPPLSQGVLDFVKSKNFHTMTPVQEATIPLFLQNKDVAVQAVTGSGKTLAFLIPVVERIRQRTLSKHQIGALVLSPTRELAMQTWRVCTELCNSMAMSPPLLLVGGGSTGGNSVNHRPVTEDLRTFQREANDIVIATPGRMEDILTRYNVLDVSELDILILDEADVLLFGKTIMDPTIATILTRLPKMRRTGIFSATTTFTNNKSIKPLLQRAGMRNPVLVNVQVAAVPASESKVSKSEGTKPKEEGNADRNNTTTEPKNATSMTYTPTSLTNYYMVTKLEERISRLTAFLQSHREQKIIVFFLTCACVDFYGSAMQKLFSVKAGGTSSGGGDNDDHDESMNIEILHGKLVQKRRENSMLRFRECKSGCSLFCTDVAARGLDVSDVDWVVQVDAPQDPSQFVHRVGRCARAGRSGSSLLLLTDKEEAYVDLLSNRQVPLQELPSNEPCRNDIEGKGRGGKHMDDDIDNELTAENSDLGKRIPDILRRIRGLVMKDRDILEKGTKAFTSYIRAYKEHVCAFIFRFASLDLGHLATSFCLLRLPKMPELRDCKGNLKNFTSAGPEIDIYAIPYLDKPREAARQRRLAAELDAGGKNAKQIKAEQRKAEQVRRQKERRQEAIEKGRKPDKKRGRNARIVDEWEELAKEERLFKKLRRGKISQEEYDEQIFGSTETGDIRKVEAADECVSDSDDDSDSSSN